MSLPFVSYGRSSLLISFLATGVLMNIARRGHLRGSGR
jgi:cell division protein FtsW (lipid II flippase)